MVKQRAIAFLLLFLSPLFLSRLSAQIIPEDDYSAPASWRQAVGGAVIGNPVAQVESVVVATDGGNLRSFSSQGNLLWDYYARGRLAPHVSRSREGTSYICRTNGILIAVNRSGRELWQMNLRAPVIFPVMNGWDGRLFVFTEGKITCLTAAGYVLWTRTLEKKIILSPIMDSLGGFVLVLEDGEVRNFDPFGNAISFMPFLPGDAPPMIPLAAVSLEIENSPPAILILYRDNLELLYPSQGSWVSLKGLLDLPSPPVAATGRKDEAAVLLNDGTIALISPGKTQILWTATGHLGPGELRNYTGSRVPGPGDINFFFDERGVYLLTKTGATSFAPDGRRLWTMQIRGAASIPSFGDDGILYSGGEDWIMYAYRLEDRVREKARVIYGEAPDGSYGMGNPGPSAQGDYYFRYDEDELDARLFEIRRAIRDGNIGPNEREYAAWLMETAEGLVATRPLDTNVRVQIQSRHRIEATRLLAYIGSRETIPFLANLFSRDGEHFVKSAAADAIGRIGVDPEGIALRAFENALLPPFRLMDEITLVAVAEATGALCRFSGPPLSDAGVRLLTILASYDSFPLTRSQARRELRSLR